MIRRKLEPIPLVIPPYEVGLKFCALDGPWRDVHRGSNLTRRQLDDVWYSQYRAAISWCVDQYGEPDDKSTRWSLACESFWFYSRNDAFLFKLVHG